MNKIIIIYIILIIIIIGIIINLLYLTPQEKVIFINGINNFIILKSNNMFNGTYYIYDNKIITINRYVFSSMNYLTINNYYKNDYELYTPKQKINIPINIKRSPRLYDGPEDPRIINYKNNLLIIYNNFYDINKIRLFMFNFNTKVNLLLNYKNSNNYEKNWSPFIYNDELYVSYFINPHIILKVNFDTGECIKLYDNPIINTDYKIYGGTPSILIPQLNLYFGIGHIKTTGLLERKRCYYCIGYLFNSKPPFELIQCSNVFTFINRHDNLGLFDGQNVEFPLGIQLINNNLFISFGFNDIKSYFIEIDYINFFSQIFSDKYKINIKAM